MLYCPKCRRTYEEGTQRFCDNDGGRLLPAPLEEKSDPAVGGVFTSLLGKTPPPENDKKNTAAPRFIPFSKTEEADKKLTSFPSAGRIFQSEQFLKPPAETSSEADESILELDPQPSPPEMFLEFDPVTKPGPPTGEPAGETIDDPAEEAPKPAPRLIKPSEIASGTASVGNRKTNPLGRAALSPDNPDALLGQTVKGRYQIVEELPEDDEDSLIYLAEDKIVAGKKVVVRVFLDDDFGDDPAEDKIFAEERVSLSHLNHPNIAGVFDSGELPEGNGFIISEFIEGESLVEILRHAGQFNTLRTARIIRQASYALSEAHQNGILHRNLKPENLVLTVSEAGIEQVKLMNFGVSRGEITDANLAYKAPEEIERGISTYASDIYALAVIAYQMLTARLPFPIETETALVKAQKAGPGLAPSALRLDLSPLADKILEKALAFVASERYPKARDFGDAFFNALTTVAPWTSEEESAAVVKPVEEKPSEFVVIPPIGEIAPPVEESPLVEESPISADIHISPSSSSEAQWAAEVKATGDLAWEKRSPEPPPTGNVWRGLVVIAGVVALLLAVFAVSRLWILNRSTELPENTQSQGSTTRNPAASPSENALNNPLPVIEGDQPPEPRLQTTPPNTQRFQNSKEGLKGELAKNFLGFEIFYPLDWTKKPSETNFLDISRPATDRIPVEQLIVTRYESRGTMTLDRANFPKFVEKSNQDLKKSLGDSFKVVSEGETTIQNGRLRVFEVKFQSEGKNEKGENIMLWGRRLWIPVQVAGVQNGFVLTLLATSFSNSVKSVDDVGVQGELAAVLDTFEPEPR